MEPLLADGERIVVNKFVYRFRPIERGDVVVFWYPRDPSVSFIKRVVALPGDTVEIRSGRVVVNGVTEPEPYLQRELPGRRQLSGDRRPQGVLLRARRPPPEQQRQPELGRGPGALHLRLRGLPLLAAATDGADPLAAPGRARHSRYTLGLGDDQASVGREDDCAPTCRAGARGRDRLRGPGVRARGRGDGGGRLQHRPLRLPGGADRSVLRRADRHHDLPAHRQLRGQSRRRRVGAAPGGGLRGARGLDRGLVLAGLGRARPLPRRARHRGHQRDRHARADAPPADARREARA